MLRNYSRRKLFILESKDNHSGIVTRIDFDRPAYVALRGSKDQGHGAIVHAVAEY